MRSYDGQFSDNRPLKRTREEKQRLVKELRDDPGAGPKPRVRPRGLPSAIRRVSGTDEK